MSTAPYAADAQELIQRSHRQTHAVRATHPTWSGPVELIPEAVSITWDENQAPRVTAALTCKVPDSQAEIDALDPRTGVRIEIDAGYIYPGGAEEVYLIADLGLRERKVNRPADTITLVAKSDEALVIDNAPHYGTSSTASSVPENMKAMIWSAVVPYPVVHITTERGKRISTQDPITDRWSTIDDLADRWNLDVYDNGLREFYIEDRVEAAGTPVLALKVGENGTILDSEATLSRDSFYNYVELYYEWTNASNVVKRVTGTAYVASGTYACTGTAGLRKYFEERDTPTEQSKANNAAASILKRMISRARGMSLSAVAAYWLRPGHTVTVQLPEGGQEQHIVSSVTFDLVSGSMTVATRLPLPVTYATVTPAGALAVLDGTETTEPAEGAAGTRLADPSPTAAGMYKTTWTATGTQGFNGNGTTNAYDLPQGNLKSLSGGNMYGYILFGGSNSEGSEPGVSISTALTGASVLKVEVWVKNASWQAQKNGTARFGYYDGTSIPATGSTPTPYQEKSGWKDGAGKWTDITDLGLVTNLVDGSCRVITLGPGKGYGGEYFGFFEGINSTTDTDEWPRLRITYVK